jgi:hypothetical protein
VDGFRYLLAFENGEPADPAAFVTVVPDWRPGMTFVAPNGQLFRILAVESEMDEERSAEKMGLLVVEPVGDALDVELTKEVRACPVYSWSHSSLAPSARSEPFPRPTDAAPQPARSAPGSAARSSRKRARTAR